MKPSKKFWDDIADKYARQPIKDEAAYAQTLDRVRAHLRPQDRVLEVGCGTGSTALKLAGDAAHIHATDLSPRMIEIAQAKARTQGVANVTFASMALGRRVHADGPFDVVMGMNLLHLVEDLEGVLAGLAEQTAKGSVLITKTACLAEMGRFWRLLLPVMQAIGKAPHVSFLSIAGLEGAIEAAGFEIIETGTYPVSPPSRFVVARRC